MNRVLYYTCHHPRADAAFWGETRRHLAGRGHSLTILGTPGDPTLAPEDGPLAVWTPRSTTQLRHHLEDHLDWSHLETCARGYGEPFDRERVLDEALSLLLQLAIERPRLLLLYNDRRRLGNLLRQLAVRYRLPFLVVERLPWPGWISVDPDGMLLDCSFLRLPPAPDTAALARVADFERLAGKNASTWWAQPRSSATELRQLLPAGKKILLFVHQVDQDAQNFAYNPHFADNASALAWTLGQLPADGSVFILGKHHPKAPSPPALYQGILGRRGLWTSEHAIEDCLAAADAIIAVNSSLLFEAILTGKPVASLGRTMLDHAQVFARLESPADHGFISRLLATPAAELQLRLERYRHHTAHAFAHAFCLRHEASPTTRDRGPAALAEHIIAACARAPLGDTDLLTRDAQDVLHSTLELHSALARSRLVRGARALGRALAPVRKILSRLPGRP
jgi:hypothetical protein